MQRKQWSRENEGREEGRVLARVLSEDLRRVRGLGEQLASYIVTAPPPGWDMSDGSSDNENLA